MIKLTCKYRIVVFACLVIALSTIGQGTYKDYQRAEHYKHFNVHKYVRNVEVNPHWREEGFCFKEETPNGQVFNLVSYQNGEQSNLTWADKLAGK